MVKEKIYKRNQSWPTWRQFHATTFAWSDCGKPLKAHSGYLFLDTRHESRSFGTRNRNVNHLTSTYERTDRHDVVSVCLLYTNVINNSGCGRKTWPFSKLNTTMKFHLFI